MLRIMEDAREALLNDQLRALVILPIAVDERVALSGCAMGTPEAVVFQCLRLIATIVNENNERANNFQLPSGLPHGNA